MSLTIEQPSMEEVSAGGCPVSSPAVDALPILATGSPEADDWDRYVLAHEQGSVCHLTGWLRAVESAFGHRPVCLQAIRDGAIVGVLPLAWVESLLGGSMLVSVPYGVYGGVLADDNESETALENRAIEMAERGKARCIEFRSEQSWHAGWKLNDRYLAFRKDLPDDVGDVLSTLPRKARAAARQATEKHHLTSDFGDQYVRKVWRLYTENMRRLASLNYPHRFFEELLNHLPAERFVNVAKSEGRVIGGLVTLVHGRTAMPYFIGERVAFRSKHVSHFLYWKSMERAVELGCTRYDFGRSRRDNEGACQFKKLMGCEPVPLAYHRWEPKGKTSRDLTPTNHLFHWPRRIWPKLPTAITRPMGAWLSKHIPG